MKKRAAGGLVGDAAGDALKGLEFGKIVGEIFGAQLLLAGRPSGIQSFREDVLVGLGEAIRRARGYRTLFEY
jgi:hypothetical protein